MTESLQELQWKRGQYYHAERDASTALLRAQRAYDDAVWALRWIDKRIAALDAAPSPSPRTPASPDPERASK